MVVVANISRTSKAEFLLVNKGATPATITIQGFSLLIANSTTLEHGQNITLNPGNWTTVQPVIA